MTEQEIAAFLSVVQYGTISEAAQALFVSQPALSRRLASLEEELGCTLLVRRKGQRYIELTDAGKAFVSLAQRWQELLAESGSLRNFIRTPSLRLASVGSVCNILLPPVAELFLQKYPECRLNIFQHHSTECYEHMESGNLDLALISDDVFSPTVETVPAMRSEFYLLSRVPGGDDPVAPNELDPLREIRLPWTPEFDLWHDYWFGSTAKAKIVLDQMPLLEYFLRHTDCWAVAPVYIADLFARRQGIFKRRLQNPPPDEIIYYLLPKDARRTNNYSRGFLRLLRAELAANHQEITTLL